jgi:uncharacterized membrane protein
MSFPPNDKSPETIGPGSESEASPSFTLESLNPTLRRIELAGWTLFVIWAVGLVVWALVEPDPYSKGWLLVLELAFVGGRAVNISHGVAEGFSHAYLIFQCGLQDIVYTLVLYPWVVRAYFGLTKLGFAGNLLKSLHRAAERQKKLLEPFGAIGLWIFVAFPFWSTGVVNGAALGFLLGMRLPLVLSVVFSAHLSSMFAMIYFFNALREPIEALGDGAIGYLPWAVLGVLVLAWLATWTYGKYRQRRAQTAP